MSVIIARIPVEFRTEGFPNTSLPRYFLANLVTYTRQEMRRTLDSNIVMKGSICKTWA